MDWNGKSSRMPSDWKFHTVKTQNKSIVTISLYHKVHFSQQKSASIAIWKTKVTVFNFEKGAQKWAVGKTQLR